MSISESTMRPGVVNTKHSFLALMHELITSPQRGEELEADERYVWVTIGPMVTESMVDAFFRKVALEKGPSDTVINIKNMGAERAFYLASYGKGPRSYLIDSRLQTDPELAAELERMCDLSNDETGP